MNFSVDRQRHLDDGVAELLEQGRGVLDGGSGLVVRGGGDRVEDEADAQAAVGRALDESERRQSGGRPERLGGGQEVRGVAHACA